MMLLLSLPQLWLFSPQLWLFLPQLWLFPPQLWLFPPQLWLFLPQLWLFLPQLWLFLPQQWLFQVLQFAAYNPLGQASCKHPQMDQRRDPLDMTSRLELNQSTDNTEYSQLDEGQILNIHPDFLDILHQSLDYSRH